jgi:hypothetical protein
MVQFQKSAGLMLSEQERILFGPEGVNLQSGIGAATLADAGIGLGRSRADIKWRK